MNLQAFDDKVIVKMERQESTIIVATREKEMNRGRIVSSAIEGLKEGTFIYYKYGRTIPCGSDEYVVVEKENVWCIDNTR